MTKYNYHIILDDGENEFWVKGCTERNNIFDWEHIPVYTTWGCENGRRLINMTHVSMIEEFIVEDEEEQREIEKDKYASAIRRANGDRKKAAELLGVSERTLYRKMAEYELR